MAGFLNVLSNIAIVFIVLFFLSIIIYFFNLDMKIASKTQPLLNKWYDHHKRRPLP